MQAPKNPKEGLELEMKRLGVSRETAIYITLRGMEALLRAEDDTKEAMDRELLKLFVRDTRDRHPQAVEHAEASLRKDLPEWIRINDEALASDQDPTTALAIHTKCTTKMAKKRLRRVQEAKEGKSISESVEMSLSESDKESFGEQWADFQAIKQI